MASILTVSLRTSPETRRTAALTAAGLGVLLVTYAALWLAGRPYEGITYDAQLYTLQALATLQPFPLGQDLFLRFRHVMMERTQINGAFYTPAGMRLAAGAAAERLSAPD